MIKNKEDTEEMWKGSTDGSYGCAMAYWEKDYLQPIVNDLEVLDKVKNILDNSFNETYEETMDKIYKTFNTYYNEQARLKNDK